MSHEQFSRGWEGVAFNANEDKKLELMNEIQRLWNEADKAEGEARRFREDARRWKVWKNSERVRYCTDMAKRWAEEAGKYRRNARALGSKLRKMK